MTHGGVGRDTGTEERCGSGEIEIRRDAQNEMLIDDDAIGIAPIGDAAEVLVGGIVGESHVRAELLESLPAIRAGVVGVDQAANRDEVPRFILGDGGADPSDAADNLMARDARVDGRHRIAPLVTDLVQVGVADAAEQNLDL
jgi:hypothetical protein